jgi:hypothetical protein
MYRTTCCRCVKRAIWVLSELRSVRTPREDVFNLFPPLRPGEFSIATSIKVSHHISFAQFILNLVNSIPAQFICVAIVRYCIQSKIPRLGVRTSSGRRQNTLHTCGCEHARCVLDQEQELCPCVPLLNNVYMWDTTVCTAVLVVP